MNAPQFLRHCPQFLFFTGKGGVGKTSIASACAVRLADEGKRVLLVSTDPASNLSEVLATPIGHRITAIPGVVGLTAIEIDPELAAADYRDRILTPLAGRLPDAELTAAREQLSGSCTTEVAAFDEFTSYLADPQVIHSFDHVVFDTAPTGHTIRLLQLPGAWTSFLATGKGDASCLGPLAGLDKHRTTYAVAVTALADPALTRVVLVTRAQSSALAEAARTATELTETGVAPTHLVVNGLLPDSPTDMSDPLYRSLYGRERTALGAVPTVLTGLHQDRVRLQVPVPIGLVGLRRLLTNQAPEPGPLDDGAAAAFSGTADLDDLVSELEVAGHGLVLCMGKGGVGKTTVAAALAVALADRGHPVHLSTTDPAAHLQTTLPESVPGLTVSRIDPTEAITAYRDHVLTTKGKDVSEAERAALAEDLRSPCNDEVAVFNRFARLVRDARLGFVVLDTAPTGHTLLLLDATGSYHRDVVRLLGPEATGYRTPLMMLQDPGLTHVLIVTTPEQTPVSEAAALQDDLQRAGINPWGWVVNNSLSGAHPSSPVLRRLERDQAVQQRRVATLAHRVVVLPLLADEPVGHDRLTALTRSPQVVT
jgi:arsenite-transporting ATPase